MINSKNVAWVMVLAVLVTSVNLMAAVSDYISIIEMSKEWDYGFPGSSLHYDFDAYMATDPTVQSASFKTPGGSEFPMIQEDGGWSYGVGSGNPSDLDVYGPGDYLFTVEVGGVDYTTSVPYEIPGGGEIPQVTQEPIITNPVHGATGVPTSLALCWESYTEGIANGIGIEIESDTSETEISLDDTSLTCIGPLTLNPDELYEVQFTFDRSYQDINGDGIGYTVDTDSQRKISFTTVPEPATLSLLAFGGLALLRKRK